MRFRAVGLVLAVAACGPGTIEDDDGEAFADLAAGWNHVEGPDGTGCAHGTDWSFWVRPASTEKIAIYFQGGGACWLGEICDLDRRPSYDPFVDDSDTPPATGIFDFASDENPIGDWSVVFVPYCTADVHVGDATRTYDVAPNDSLPAGTVEIAHRGAANATAALLWLFERIHDPATVLVTGVSAGSLGSAVHAHTVARQYPTADVVQLGDAAGGYRAPDAIPTVLDAWGAHRTLEAVAGRPLTPDRFELVYTDAFGRAPNLRMAQINYDRDEVQLQFLSLLGVRGTPLIELLDANLAEIVASSDDFSSYILPGDHHGIIRDDLFYEASVDGVRLRDWTADLIAGEDVRSISCAACR